MWELVKDIPLGRLSMRKYLRFATALLVVCFAYIFITAPVTHAATDATWENGNVVYNDNEYTSSGKSKGTESHNIPKDSQLYIFNKPVAGASASNTKAYVIYFAPGNDPGTSKSATYQTFDYDGKDGYTNPSAKETISIDPTGASATTSGTTSCAIEGIGYIVCPITKFLAKGMDFVYSLVDGFLEVKPLMTTQDQAMYRAWSYMRNFANIAFVIAFLIIIYSQITSIGLSNYDIKKMLPRIVIAAILVNTSYWICAAAIDVFNILGYGTQSLFIGIRNSLVGAEGNSWDVVSWESMSSLILSGGSALAGAGIATYLGITAASVAVAGAGISGLIFLLLPILLSVLFVILVTFLILAARQAIITILVILAPLAFVAYLLPNTEKWFEKWRSALFTLLLLFPAFSLVFGGSQLAAAAIIQNATSLNMILLAMAVQVAPLAITPLLLRLGGGVLNRFANIVNNPAKGVFDRGKSWARERSDQNRSAGIAALDRRAHERGFTGNRPNRSIRPTRSGRFIENAGNRLNPNNMAYKREYNRRDREGMKTANEGLSQGYFDATEAGTRIYSRSQEGSIRKHSAEEANSRAFQRALHDANSVSLDPENQRSFELRGLHHQAHIDKGAAEVYSNALTQHAELDLQTQINDANGPLRHAKVHSDVNAGLAKLQTARVEADGKEALQNHIDNDRALKLMKIATFVTEQQAASIDTRLAKNAEARWNQLSRTDPGLQELRLQEVQATDSTKRVEEQWNTLVANIKASGESAPNLAAQNTSLANSIKNITQELEVESQAQNSAKVVQTSNFVEALKNEPGLRKRAGGIDPGGANRVFAAAKTAVTKELIEATDNFQNTLPLPISSNNQKLGELFGSTTSLTQRVAYGRLLAKNGPGVSILREQLSKLTKTMDADDPYLLDLKEILASDSTFKAAGRDFEVWGNNEPDPETGEIFTNFDAATNSVKTWNDISATRFASMSKPSQMHTLNLLQREDKPNLQELVERIMRSTARDNVKGVPDKALKRLAEDVNADISDLIGRSTEDDE